MRGGGAHCRRPGSCYGSRAVGRGPDNVPSPHCTAGELKGGVAEVKAIRLQSLAFPGKDGARQSEAGSAGLLEGRAWDDAPRAVGEGVGRTGREAENVDDDDDIRRARLGEEVDAQ